MDQNNSNMKRKRDSNEENDDIVVNDNPLVAAVKEEDISCVQELNMLLGHLAWHGITVIWR